MKTFSLPSSDGHFSAAWKVTFASKTKELLVLEMNLQRTFLDRTQEPINAAFVPDASIALYQIVSSWQSLRTLREHLHDWLATQAAFSIHLADDPGQSLRVGLGLRDDILCSAHKPVFEAEYNAGPAVQTKWAYVVDQSCIQLMLDELGSLLKHAEHPHES